MDRWEGKIAVITGASAGIGAAICVRLASAGLKVIGLARRPNLVDNLNSDVSGTGCIYSRSCDVSKPEDIIAAFAWIEQEFGGVDILVNNAGMIIPGHITDVGDVKLSDEDILSTIDVNIKGLVMCTRQAVASMKKREFDGHIIQINSAAGHYIPFNPHFNVYSSTKYAVTAFTTALLHELAEYKSKIKVTSISPGLVRTNMSQGLHDKLPLLDPSEIADVVVYTLSTPPHINISELGLAHVAEKKL